MSGLAHRPDPALLARLEAAGRLQWFMDALQAVHDVAGARC
jgi:hypothetical protein